MRTGFVIAHDGSLVSLDAVERITYSSGPRTQPHPHSADAHLFSSFSSPRQRGYHLHMHTGTDEEWVVYAGEDLQLRPLTDLQKVAAEMKAPKQTRSDPIKATVDRALGSQLDG